MRERINRTLAMLIAVLIVTALPMNAYAEEEEEIITTPKQEADAIYTEYEVLDDAGYTVNMYHSLQGPLCDQAFLYGQGKNHLVTDYFNISINNDLRIQEIASAVRIRVKIPQDLVKKGRTWWMIAISSFGIPYYFDDEDEDDKTITFSANRFYAFAMCYTDEKQEKKKEEEKKEVKDENPRSRMHTIADSKTISGKAKEDLSLMNANTAEGQVFYGSKVSRMPKIKSQMKKASENSGEQQAEGMQPISFGM